MPLNERRHQYQALEQRAHSVAAALAVPVTDALMNEELGLIPHTGLTDDYIAEILDSNRDAMVYVVVADTEGVVTHSNLWSAVGRPFQRALEPASISQAPGRRDPDRRERRARSSRSASRCTSRPGSGEPWRWASRSSRSSGPSS